MVQLFRGTLSIVMMHRLPFGTWLNYIVRINSMTHHFGEPVQFTFDTPDEGQGAPKGTDDV